MSMEKTLLIYACLKGMTETMSDGHAMRLLDWTGPLIGKLQASKTYARVMEDVRSGECWTALKEMSVNAQEVEREFGEIEIDHEGLIWVITLEIASSLFNFEMLLAATCFFIAAQENNLHRIRHDRMRLALTYMHFRMLKKLAEDTDDHQGQ